MATLRQFSVLQETTRKQSSLHIFLQQFNLDSIPWKIVQSFRSQETARSIDTVKIFTVY